MPPLQLFPYLRPNVLPLVSFCLLLVACGGAWATVPLAPPDVLIPLGSTWKYSDTGVRPAGSGWRTDSFDDSAWAFAPAPLGYGDSNLAFNGVSYGNDTQNKHISTQFRHSFGGVSESSCYAVMELRAAADDGAIFYLNGFPLSSIGMSFYTSFSDFLNPPVDERALVLYASETQAYRAYAPWPRPALLRDGLNVLAVEVHQGGSSSSDMRLDVELRAWKRADCQAAETTVPVVSAGSTPWRYWDNSSAPDSAFIEASFNDTNWKVAPFCNQCGYGDNDESTVLAKNGPRTVFRTIVPNIRADCLVTVTGDIIFDDCFAMHINGQLQGATGNMQPRNGIRSWNFEDYCEGYGPPNDGFPAIPIALDPRVFIQGDNVIVVEVVRSSAGSSDLSFALNLHATFDSNCLSQSFTTATPALFTTALTTAAAPAGTTAAILAGTTAAAPAGTPSAPGGQVKESSEAQDDSGLIVALVVVCVLLALCAAGTLVFVLRRNRKKADYLSAQSASEYGVELGGVHMSVTHPSGPRSTLQADILAPEELDPRFIIPFDALQLGEELASGNFGIVYKGEFMSNSCVVKMSKDDSAEQREDAMREAFMLSQLRTHASICAFYGVALSDEHPPCLVTEFIEGGNLERYLADHRNRLTGRDAVNLFRDLAAGLSVLHASGVLHLDIAARNLLVLAHESPLKLRICDFGLSRLMANGEDSVSAVGAMAPWRHTDPAVATTDVFTPASDKWAMGVCAWEILARERPFAKISSAADVFAAVRSGTRLAKPDVAQHPTAQVSEIVVDELYNVMMQCWEPSPANRPDLKLLCDGFNEILKREDHELNGEVDRDMCHSAAGCGIDDVFGAGDGSEAGANTYDQWRPNERESEYSSGSSWIAGLPKVVPDADETVWRRANGEYDPMTVSSNESASPSDGGTLSGSNAAKTTPAEGNGEESLLSEEIQDDPPGDMNDVPVEKEELDTSDISEKGANKDRELSHPEEIHDAVTDFDSASFLETKDATQAKMRQAIALLNEKAGREEANGDHAAAAATAEKVALLKDQWLTLYQTPFQ